MVCEDGLTANPENDGGVPQTPPANVCPAGHAHALPFQVWPLLQMLAQELPFHEVPAPQVTQLEPLQLVPPGHAHALPFQVWPPMQMLAQLEPFQEVPAAQVTQLDPFQLEPTAHAQAEPFQVWPPVQMLAQVLPFQATPAGQAALTAAALTLVEPHELLAVAMQFVVPGVGAAKAPLPPVEGVSVYDAGLARHARSRRSAAAGSRGPGCRIRGRRRTRL